MMKALCFILLFVLSAYEVWTQETYSHQYSSVPQTARYEIIQSERGARYK